MAQSTTRTLELTSTLDIGTVPAEAAAAEAADTQAVRRRPAKTARAATARAATAHRVSAKRRRARVDWYGLAVLLLILLSGAVAVDRLLWSWQP